MQFIKSIYHKIKDVTLAGVLKKIANYFIKDYGRMLNFKIDSENKKLYFEVLLKGEASTIWIELEEYDFVIDGEENYITFEGVKASREWMDVLINQLIEKQGGKIPLEPDQVKLLKLVL